MKTTTVDRRIANAQCLEQASDLLSPLNATSPRPAQSVALALQHAERAFHDAQNYMGGVERNMMRVGILRLRAMNDSLTADRRVGPGDYAAMVATASDFSRVAQTIRSRMARLAKPSEDLQDGPFLLVREGRAQVPSLGSAPIPEMDEAWHAAEHFRQNLPRSLPQGRGFAMYRCPIVAFLKNYVGDTALQRSGLEWRRLSSGGLGRSLGMGRTGSDGLHCVLFGNQILLGFPREALEADRQGTIDRAVAQVSSRIGPLTAPLGERAAFLISPGSKLSWLWVVPSSVMRTTHMLVREANFPWKTEHVQVTDEQRRAMKREIDQINRQAEVTLQRGGTLDARDLSRQSELLEKLDRSRPAGGGGPDLATRRVAMESTIAKRTAPLVARRTDLSEQVREIGKATVMQARVRQLKAEIRKIEAEIAAIRAEEMQKARAKMARDARTRPPEED